MFLSWNTEDQDKVLAYQHWVRMACPDCGTREEEWAEDADYFIGDLYHCEGCDRMQQEQSNIPDGAKGVHVRLLPKAVALARIERGEGLA